MQPADTIASQHAAALAAVNLKEMQPAHTAPMPAPAAPMPAPAPLPAAQPPPPPPPPSPLAVKSDPSAPTWVISRDPSPRSTFSPPRSDLELRHAAPFSHARPFLNPEQSSPPPLVDNVKPVSAALSRKRPFESTDTPLVKRKKVKKNNNKADKAENNVAKQTPGPIFRKSSALLLSHSYLLRDPHVEDALKEFLFPIIMAENGARPKWAACVLCLSHTRGKGHIYFQSFPLKMRKIRNHLASLHAKLDADNYVQLNVDEKLAFLRRDLPPFNAVTNHPLLRNLEDSPSWNEAEYNRVFHSDSSAAQLASYSSPLADKVPAKQVTPAVRSAKRHKKEAALRKVLTRAFNHPKQMRHLPKMFCSDGEDLRASPSHSLCLDDPDITCGRRNFTQGMTMNVTHVLDSRNRKLNCSHEFDNLRHVLQNAKPLSHPEIPRLVLGDKLRDPLREKLATADDAFLTLTASMPPGGENTTAAKRVDVQYFTPVSALILFYLMRGVPCSVITELVDAMLQEEENVGKSRTGTMLPSVVLTGDSVCAVNMQLTRLLLDEKNRYSWALTFLTRPCPELGEDGVEVLVATRNEKMVRSDLHVVSLRYADRIDESIVAFFDAICADWKSRLVGLNSGIDVADAKRKQVERTIFEVLKAVEGVGNVLLIDKEVGRSGRPIFADVVGKMSEEEMSRLVDSHLKRLGQSMSKNEILNAWRTLAIDERVEHAYSPHADCEENNVEYVENRGIRNFVDDWAPFETLRNFAYSLRPLYERYEIGADQIGCFRAGVICGTKGNISSMVDAGLERVFHARSLVKAWCMMVMTEKGENGKCKWAKNGCMWSENWVNVVREVYGGDALVGAG
ncbi:unnamed protein product [Agarophyton chilense]|eukprot:gb/GEZJ01001030.1/.p1 GENE.gb/GEZJ01001030.1/~~gb/GEZJ01001030.1/.p1  ORF type:complete len:849 (+),score=118.28 gb/GEZJ01001030.1/:135-2681(+)